MRFDQLCLRLAWLSAVSVMLLPASTGLASDTDLFRTNVPPNIVLLVDNSSSMAIQTWHPDYGLRIPDGSGGTIAAKNQTECTDWRDTITAANPKQKIRVYVSARRLSYKDPNNETMRWDRLPKNAWETIPILAPDGSILYDDANSNGVKDGSEEDMYYNFPNPALGDSTWADRTTWTSPGGDVVRRPILDVFGNHLYYDANGNGSQDLPEDRDLYYELRTNNGRARGASAKIYSRVDPAGLSAAMGIDPLTLQITNNDICGTNATGWTLFDGNDPLAAAPSGVVMQILPQYMDWLFSSHGAAALPQTFIPTLANDGIRDKSSCVTLLGGEGPTYETLRRSRLQALTLILRTVICEVNQVGEVRFGFAQFRFGGKGGDDNGGYVAVPVENWFEADGVTPNSYTIHGVTGTHEEHLRRVIRTSAPDAQTPLAESLFQTYTYFMPRTAADMPYGRAPDGTENTTRFPVYNYDTSLYDPLAGYDSDDDDFPPNLADVGGRYVGPIPLNPNADADGRAAPDPLLYPCQKNFVLLITDGGSAGDDFTDNDDKINAAFDPTPLVETHTDIGYSDFTTLIGDHYRNPDGTPDETEPNTSGGTSTKYMDDIAYFMNRHDMRPDMDGLQNVEIYTVGYSTDSAASGVVTNVEKAAIRGNGKYFESSDADKLAQDIVEAITDIIDKAQAFTSATVPASRTTDGNNFYSSFFLPKSDSPFWEGHLKNFGFTGGGDIVTPDGRCATGSDIAATPPCSSGSLRTFETAHWDAADEIPAPDDRNLYVEFGATAPFKQPAEFKFTDRSDPAFTLPSGATVAGETAFNLAAGIDDLEEPYDGLASPTDENMALALHDVLRGCEFGSDPCVSRANDAGEKIYLGDIFHSNPVVVGSPNSPINEQSYQAFASGKRERTRVIYTGGNDGFLHAFNAGDWQTDDGGSPPTPLVPPRHDRGTGEELFGFMPWQIRATIKDLPKQTSFPRSVETVDGSPIVADVWFYRDIDPGSGEPTTVNTALTPDDLESRRWRTVLMGGLRNGGTSYYALDVTDPTATAAEDPQGKYPRYLWGFPCDDCSNPGTLNGSTSIEATHMGFTWSEPVITRVRVAGAAANPNGSDRWVAIFGAGYHPDGDPNGANYKQVGDVGFSPKGRAIYMVDMTTGEVLAKKVFDSTATALSSTIEPQVGIKEFHYAFASAPAVFDLDFDGYADVIYIGDLGGNLWKWVVTAKGHDPINGSTPNNDIAQPNWPFRRVFRAGSSLEPTLPPEQQSPAATFSLANHYQSFFFPPTGVLRQGKLVLGFGAGERANPKGPASLFGDGSNANNNHYYVVKDNDALESSATLSVPHPITDSLDESDLADFDAATPMTCSQMQTTASGYFITARDAEKFITNSVIFLGTVFTGSYQPPDPTSTAAFCEASGQAYLYAFGVDCGDGLFTSGGGSSADQRRKAIGSGIPTRPRVSVGDLNQGQSGGGCTNKVVVITSDGFIENDCPGSLPSSGVGIRSWQQR